MPGDLGERDARGRGRRGRVLAREHEQIVDQPREPLGARGEIGERLGVGAVAGDVLGVPAERRERRAQLVRRVGDEAALALAGLCEGAEHRC